MLKFSVVTNDLDGWSRQRFGFGALSIYLSFVDVSRYISDDGTDSDGLWEELKRMEYDFILCDTPAVYNYLPPTHTLLVGGKMSAMGLTQGIAALRNGGDVKFYIWARQENPIGQKVREFLDEWGYPCIYPLETKEESRSSQAFHIVCSREGYMAARNLPCVILLPSEEAAEALCNFLTLVLYDYTPPECLGKNLESDDIPHGKGTGGKHRRKRR